ncbi:HAD family hydrolase [Candidatus Bathyarchaeota archaeon]|nr:HAD family hydrolase [Candidatus Bathyarchaeota archaeon]
MAKHRMKVKALLIDLDGTIVNIKEPCIEAAKKAISTLRFKKIDSEIGLEIAKKLQSNLPLDETFTKFGIDKGVGKEFLKAFLNAWYTIVTKKTTALPKVHKTLQKLSEHHQLVLITSRNMPKEPIEQELRRLGLTQYFKFVMTSQDVEEPKPSPQAFVKAANNLKVSIRDCAVVGDSIVDIQAGKSAGAKTIAVLSGLFGREEFEAEKPDLIIENISTLPKHLSESR